MLHRLGVTALLATSLLALAGCGNTPGSRALSGGAIGAGTGAIIGAATGGSAATGALIGAGVGAIGGAVTNKNQVNLGN
jgi:osmotically inducible lipoprotein OsmB